MAPDYTSSDADAALSSSAATAASAASKATNAESDVTDLLKSADSLMTPGAAARRDGGELLTIHCTYAAAG